MGDEFDFEPFAWVTPYVAKHVIPPLRMFSSSPFVVEYRSHRDFLVTPIPTDLRKLKKPVHDRLPPASAGQPGNDIADVEIIREDWMKRKVQDEVLSQSEHKAVLRCA